MSRMTTMELQTMNSLYERKNKSLQNAIGELHISEVKNDSDFQKAVQRIKDDILLMPVTILDPQITGHYLSTIQAPPNFNNPFGGEQRVNIITVSFPFNGSEELFYFRTGASLTIDTIFVPNGSNVDVEVKLASLDKARALSEAKNKMSTTFELISQNNPVIESWSRQMEAIIDEQAQAKRKELIEFYS